MGSTNLIEPLPPPSLEAELPTLAQRFPLRILIAEDNAVNQKVILLLLGKLGYQADVAGDGQQVLDRRAGAYQVILMDLQMPELDGIEATRRIRSRWSAEEQPWIIAVTASTTPGAKELCLDAGMNDYLGKPLQIEALAGALERCGRKRKNADSQVEGPEPGVSCEHLAALKDLTSGDQAQLQDLIDLFIAGTRTSLTEIRVALAHQQASVLSRQAHNLKGSSGAVGALRLAWLCLELENQANRQDLTSAANSVQALEREFDQVCADLQLAVIHG